MIAFLIFISCVTAWSHLIFVARACRFSLLIFGSDKMQLEAKTADNARMWFLAFQVRTNSDFAAT